MTPVSRRRETLEIDHGSIPQKGSPLASPKMGKKFLATSMLYGKVKMTDPK